ncbi:hypothetical protein ACQUQU_05855 [Thalassolituus sp. LLYu03]|uniref:hypothetical protein n=1 Tax=Thalassolituus sp. LLYu03 TaxID=3421656 RepID=UPI003D2955C4
MHYSSASFSGLTDASGQFEYKAGEQITFALGNIPLGEVSAVAQIPLYTLLSSRYSLPQSERELRSALRAPSYSAVYSQLQDKQERIWQSSAGDVHQVANTVRLLLSLDSDRDASNGLDLITGNWNTVLGTELGLDLTIPLESFAEQKSILQLQQQETLPSLAMRPSDSLSLLYASAGVDLPAQVRLGGRPGVGTTVWDYEYSTAGEVVAINTTVSGGASRTEKAYDSSGNLTRYQHASGADHDSYNNLDELVVTYNAFGMRSSETTTKTVNNVTTRETLKEYAYLDDRVRLSEVTESINGNANVDRIFEFRSADRYTYNSNGDLSQVSLFELADTESEKSRSVLTYNSEGLERINDYYYSMDPVKTRVSDFWASTREDGSSVYSSRIEGDDDEMPGTAQYYSELTETVDTLGRLIERKVAITPKSGNNAIRVYKVLYEYDDSGRFSRCEISGFLSEYYANQGAPKYYAEEQEASYLNGLLTEVVTRRDTTGDGATDTETATAYSLGDDGELLSYGYVGEGQLPVKVFTYGQLTDRALTAADGVRYLVEDYLENKRSPLDKSAVAEPGRRAGDHCYINPFRFSN